MSFSRPERLAGYKDDQIWKEGAAKGAFIYFYVIHKQDPVTNLKSAKKLGRRGLQVGCSIFAYIFFSLQSETKRTEIRFACISLVRFEVFASFFSQYSLIFA